MVRQRLRHVMWTNGVTSVTSIGHCTLSPDHLVWNIPPVEIPVAHLQSKIICLFLTNSFRKLLSSLFSSVDGFFSLFG